MRKNKGFTLIELLAVILILGIIALIAIPTVNNVINQSRQGAWAATGNGIIKAMDQDVQLCDLNSEGAGAEAVCPDDGNYKLDATTYSKIGVKGEMPLLTDVAVLHIVDGESYIAFTANSGRIKCSNFISGATYGTPAVPTTGSNTTTFAVKCNYN